MKSCAYQIKCAGVCDFTDACSYLKTPIVDLIVGSGEDATTLSAHEGMLTAAPFFAERAAAFKSGSKVRSPNHCAAQINTFQRKIDLVDENVEAVGSVIEYLYNGEYFPKRIHPKEKHSALEPDPTVPAQDVEGIALLRHARVYTLAEKFGIPQLKSLAHTKIHRTEATAKGEIRYARYVYQNTEADDTTIRKPVAAFWAQRSHVLRHEAESEFKQLCLEFPQFGFDVLSMVLDAREKKGEKAGPLVQIGGEVPSSTPASGRKRRRDV